MNFDKIYVMAMFISSAIEMFLAYDFYKTFLVERNIVNKRYQTIILVGSATCINTYINLQNNNKLNVLGILLIYFIMCMVFFEGKIWGKLLYWLLPILVGMSSELIYSVLIGISYKVPTNQIYSNSLLMISSIFMTKLLFFLLVIVIKQLTKKQIKKLPGKTFGTFLIIPFGTLGVMFMMPYLCAPPKELSGTYFLLILFYSMLLVGNIIIFYVFMNYYEMLEEKRVREISEAKYKEKVLHFEHMDHAEQRRKENMHNIKYYLKQIGIYARDRNIQEIENVLNDLQIEIKKEEKEIICTNKFLNALLNDYKEECEQLHIEHSFFVEPGFSVDFVSDIDLAAILGNLIDNAIVASRKTKKPKVYLDFFLQNEGKIIVMRVQNSYTEKIIEKNGVLQTTKQDHNGHGIGLTSVKNTVEKYNGYTQIDYDEASYSFTIVMPNQNYYKKLY